MPSPEFKKKMRNAITQYLRELRDGCVDCIALQRKKLPKGASGPFCLKHDKEAMRVILEPRTHEGFKEFFKGFK